MKPLIGPLLRAMHRLAKEHNQSPTAGLLSAKPGQPARYVLCSSAHTRGLQDMAETRTRDVTATSSLIRRLQPTEATHGSGSWFMWNALNGALKPVCTMLMRLHKPHAVAWTHVCSFWACTCSGRAVRTDSVG